MRRDRKRSEGTRPTWPRVDAISNQQSAISGAPGHVSTMFWKMELTELPGASGDVAPALAAGLRAHLREERRRDAKVSGGRRRDAKVSDGRRRDAIAREGMRRTQKGCEGMRRDAKGCEGMRRPQTDAEGFRMARGAVEAVLRRALGGCAGGCSGGRSEDAQEGAREGAHCGRSKRCSAHAPHVHAHFSTSSGS